MPARDVCLGKRLLLVSVGNRAKLDSFFSKDQIQGGISILSVKVLYVLGEAVQGFFVCVSTTMCFPSSL